MKGAKLRPPPINTPFIPYPAGLVKNATTASDVVDVTPEKRGRKNIRGGGAIDESYTDAY